MISFTSNFQPVGRPAARASNDSSTPGALHFPVARRSPLRCLLGDGDWVVARFTLEGTHSGDFYGIPATQRKVTAEGVDLLRFRDGLIAEWIYYEDALGVFAQLGALPPDLSHVAGPRHG